uniref:Uncharacterized protein n=1 Tax=Ditylenchus dipsaci TaxID=166011 RepID=A0A915CWI6_9BILA
MIKSNDQGRHSTRRIILAMDKFLSGSNSSLQYLDVSFVIYRYQNFYLGDSKNPFVNARPSASKSPTVVSTRRERCIPGYFDADHSVESSSSSRTIQGCLRILSSTVRSSHRLYFACGWNGDRSKSL